jgi:hypothetical protein
MLRHDVAWAYVCIDQSEEKCWYIDLVEHFLFFDSVSSRLSLEQLRLVLSILHMGMDT